MKDPSLTLSDPAFIGDKDRYFMELAILIGSANTHPGHQGGAVVVRGRELLSEGRSLLTSCKAEVDAVGYAVAAAAKKGAPLTGAVVYTSRYPFTQSLFQCWIMGINKVIVLAHEWDTVYKQEFRRCARLSRELGLSVEALFLDEESDWFSPAAARAYTEAGRNHEYQGEREGLERFHDFEDQAHE